MKILIFGHQGQVGTSLTTNVSAAGHEVVGLDREQIDFGDGNAVKSAITTHAPDLVINVCAYTAVDKAEEETQLADAVNHLGVAAMAEQCANDDIVCFHISTDYVYAGDANTPYLEDAPTAPLSVYGKTKLAGDQALIAARAKHIILRTSWVFGEHGNNFVKTMLRLAGSRDELSVVADQHGRPSYAGDIVSSLLAFVERLDRDKTLPWGIYHCCSEGETTWHGFAQAIFTRAVELQLLAKAPLVHPIPTSGYPTPAPRPAYSVLNTDKLSDFLGQPLPHWQKGLDQVLQHLKQLDA